MLGNLARRQSTGALLNEPPEHLQASLLRERGKSAYGICRFHTSMIVEIMPDCQVGRCVYRPSSAA